jgi:hypothetical protein
MMALNMVVHFLVCDKLSSYISGHHTKNFDKNKDTYEDILTKTRNESLGERVRGRILAGNYYLLEEYVLFFTVLKDYISFIS